jgi:hypothetical protein
LEAKFSEMSELVDNLVCFTGYLYKEVEPKTGRSSVALQTLATATMSDLPDNRAEAVAWPHVDQSVLEESRNNILDFWRIKNARFN